MCCTNRNKTEKCNNTVKLPNSLKEVSGVGFWDKELFCIQDSGNKNEIVVLDTFGNSNRKITILNAKNIDWEDLTFDKKGNLYIGDFGNNENKRKDLTIYKINNTELYKNSANYEYKITFNYPEQREFPPNKKNLFFDCEAFFEFENNFYLFTKNHGKNFDGSSLVYKIPNKKGNHNAELIDTIYTDSKHKSFAITSAAIASNQKSFVVLTHSKIWHFSINNSSITNSKSSSISLDSNSQKEAICFKNDQTVLIADEKVKNTGGNLYTISIKNQVELTVDLNEKLFLNTLDK
ncbi:hypothetical protein J3495_09715 [Flavobacterium sp. P7388]|uniref:SMP-30/Gluconolactonase/LRE-like region domain-containing protein n=1 Tax=Flavobacterium geliluteum TaxID=2816120 RepID=A0A940XEN7_9FLAO|nr:hypothetical protein [Flavobacterium geliluteum]